MLEFGEVEGWREAGGRKQGSQAGSRVGGGGGGGGL